MDRIRIARNLVRIARQFVEEADYGQAVTNTSLQKYKKNGENAMAQAFISCFNVITMKMIRNTYEYLQKKKEGALFPIDSLEYTATTPFSIFLPDTNEWNLPKYRKHTGSGRTLVYPDNGRDLLKEYTDDMHRRGMPEDLDADSMDPDELEELYPATFVQKDVRDKPSPYTLAMRFLRIPSSKGETLRISFTIFNYGRTRSDSDDIDLSRLLGGSDLEQAIAESSPVSVVQKIKAMLRKTVQNIVREHSDFLVYDAAEDGTNSLAASISPDPYYDLN